MATYKIIIEPEFEADFNKLTNFERERILKIRDKLKENPYAGKPLGYDWFREKYLNGNRLYYLIYENMKVVLIVAMSDKKTQQKTIDLVQQGLAYYKDEVERMLSSTL